MKLHQVEVGREHIFSGVCGPAVTRVAEARPDGWIRIEVPAVDDTGGYVLVEDWAHAEDLEPLTAGEDEEGGASGEGEPPRPYGRGFVTLPSGWGCWRTLPSRHRGQLA
jgi:hypothetical protein